MILYPAIVAEEALRAIIRSLGTLLVVMPFPPCYALPDPAVTTAVPSQRPNGEPEF